MSCGLTLNPFVSRGSARRVREVRQDVPAHGPVSRVLLHLHAPWPRHPALLRRLREWGVLRHRGARRRGTQRRSDLSVLLTQRGISFFAWGNLLLNSITSLYFSPREPTEECVNITKDYTDETDCIGKSWDSVKVGCHNDCYEAVCAEVILNSQTHYISLLRMLKISFKYFSSII